MVEIKIYLEGGGDQNSLRMMCRKGFATFFGKTGLKERKCMPRLVACGGRRQAYDDFCTAMRTRKKDQLILLLVDSEGEIKQNLSPWEFVKQRKPDCWDRPCDANDDQLYFMVQCMESWLLADKRALEEYYGQGFAVNCLPDNLEIEQIEKKRVMECLEKATKSTSKGKYSKGRHSFELLERIDPENVGAASPHAKRLIDFLSQQSSH